MALLPLIILCTFLVGVRSQGSLACPDGTLSSIDKSTCYMVVRTNKTFIEGETFCVSSYGGHLCSFHNGFDNMIVNDYARNFLGVNSTFFIGANDLIQPNQWQWTDGSDFDFNDFGWDGGSVPQYYDCAHVSAVEGSWKKVDCYDSTNICCIVPKVTSLSTPSF